ncbi:glucose dehydrogenase [Pseudomonas putida]|uniref:glucose dehydrogenase n=1 Tax=Pseudomonas putida TaxID=303 RepID=UPI001F5269D5|nr:glucose dehydrogenase [Pseudomonas putida]MCI1035883.1 glucose dehydrogenase [Pseudomonas putida]
MNVRSNDLTKHGQAQLGRGAAWQVATVLLAVALALFAFAMFVGGVWLIVLGGSWYYGLAGAGSLLTAVLLWQERRSAFHLFAVIWGLTVIWVLWEVGLDWWGLVPRLVAMTVIFILIGLLSPILRRVATPK